MCVNSSSNLCCSSLKYSQLPHGQHRAAVPGGHAPGTRGDPSRCCKFLKSSLLFIHPVAIYELMNHVKDILSVMGVSLPVSQIQP